MAHIIQQLHDSKAVLINLLVGGGAMITVTAPLFRWTGADGGSHYLTIPEPQADELRGHALAHRRGFGSVRVEATLGGVTWRTSAFPQKTGGYFLPVKMDVCRRAGITAGDKVTVELVLL
jgi:hypothetical protein